MVCAVACMTTAARSPVAVDLALRFGPGAPGEQRGQQVLGHREVAGVRQRRSDVLNQVRGNGTGWRGAAGARMDQVAS
jgi:hypothetical protein